MENFSQKIKNNAGFTLIELIISILILSVAVVGIFSAFSAAVILTADQSDRLVATYLAQEGMEIVGNIRDTNWLKINKDPLAGYTWVDTLNNCAQSYGCEVDYTTGTGVSGAWAVTPSATGDYLNKDTNDFYYYDAGNPSPTKFKRKIIITCLPSGNCATDHILKVVVDVSWKQKANILNLNPSSDVLNGNCASSNCIKVERTLYNWY
jgi:prepilin-type N-terminal cleavage/methylation domain-containing protein